MRRLGNIDAWLGQSWALISELCVFMLCLLFVVILFVSQWLQCRSSGRSVQLLALHQGAGGCMHIPTPSLPPRQCLPVNASPSLPPLHCSHSHHLVLSHLTPTCRGITISPHAVLSTVLVSPPRGQTRLSHRWNLAPLHSIVYGSTKGFVSYGGFAHVGVPSHTLSV
jgi:hypothetical protein